MVLEPVSYPSFLPSKKKKIPLIPQDPSIQGLAALLFNGLLLHLTQILQSQHLPLDLKLPMESDLPLVFLEYPTSLLGDSWLMVAEKK